MTEHDGPEQNPAQGLATDLLGIADLILTLAKVEANSLDLTEDQIAARPLAFARRDELMIDALIALREERLPEGLTITTETGPMHGFEIVVGVVSLERSAQIRRPVDSLRRTGVFETSSQILAILGVEDVIVIESESNLGN